MPRPPFSSPLRPTCAFVCLCAPCSVLGLPALCRPSCVGSAPMPFNAGPLLMSSDAGLDLMPSDVGPAPMPSDAGLVPDNCWVCSRAEDTTRTLHGLGGIASSSELLHAGECPWSLPGHGQRCSPWVHFVSAICCCGVLLLVYVCFTLRTSCWCCWFWLLLQGKIGGDLCAPYCIATRVAAALVI